MLTQANPITKQAEKALLMTFATNLLQYCADNAISVNKLCKELKISSSRLYEMKRGDYDRFISFYTLCNLSCAVGCSLSDLLVERADEGASPVKEGKRKTYK